MVTLSGNLLVIIAVRLNFRLQNPMYFFLSNLVVIDICFSTTIVPKMLSNSLSQDKTISLLGCAAQMYFHLALGATECLILAVMAYDRNFILLGLSNILSLKILFFLLFSLMYMLILSGNLLLILMVRLHYQLQTPMYFFLSNLSFIDICFCSTVVPKMLANTISRNQSISLWG
ncbi:hypothetical protein AB205_0062940, partial [Aquarana catesbeiana]